MGSFVPCRTVLDPLPLFFFLRAVMHSSPSSSSSSSFSLATLAQYAFLALLAYVFAGAPLYEMLFAGSGEASYSYSRDASASSMSPQKLESLVIPDANLTCEAHAFRGVHILNREPLVVYIEGFLGAEEADEVVRLR